MNSRLRALRRAWPLWLYMALMLALEYAGAEAAREALRYQRAAVLAEGEIWRLLTGHLVHLGPSHLWLNLAALGVGWLLCGGAYSMGRWALLALACGLGISLAFLLFEPRLDWYVGQSGVLHGLLAAGALAWILRREPGGWPLLLLLASKLAWEQWSGPLPLSAESAGGPVVVDAHLYGALAGLAAGAALRAPARRGDADETPVSDR